MHPILRTMRCRIWSSEKKNRFKRYIYIYIYILSAANTRLLYIGAKRSRRRAWWLCGYVFRSYSREPLVSRLSALHEKSNETAAARSHHLSINNPARRERIVAREEGNARAKVRKARYLNSSEAERRTNKASGDKYSTSPGKLRQSWVYEPLSLYSELRSFATARPVATVTKRRLDGKVACACAKEKDLGFTTRYIVYRMRKFRKWHSIEWQVFKCRARGTARSGAKSRLDRSWWWKTMRGRRQESRQDYRRWDHPKRPRTIVHTRRMVNDSENLS